MPEEMNTESPEEGQDQALTSQVDDADGDSQEENEPAEPDWMKDFSPNKAYRRIREQARSIEQLKKTAETAKERAASIEKKASSADELAEQRDALAKERDSLSMENLRLNVGYELGLPLPLARRLSGSSREELIADAEELVKIAGAGVPRQRKPVEALRSGGEGDKEPEETDLSKIGSRMYSR